MTCEPDWIETIVESYSGILLETRSIGRHDNFIKALTGERKKTSSLARTMLGVA